MKQELVEGALVRGLIGVGVGGCFYVLCGFYIGSFEGRS